MPHEAGKSRYMKAKRNLTQLRLFAGLLLALPAAVHAGVNTWTAVTGAAGNWSNSTNWTGAPTTGGAPNGAGNVAAKGIGGVALTLDMPETIGQVEDTTSASQGGMTINASGTIAMTMDNTGGNGNDAGDNNSFIGQTVSSALTFLPDIIIQNTDLDFANTGSTQPVLTIGTLGVSTITATSPQNLFIKQNKANTTQPININSSIGGSGSVITVQNVGTCTNAARMNLNGVVGPNANVVQNSTNTILSLNAANTYTGGTTINNGTLALGAGGSIAGSASLVIAAGATFDVSAVGSPYILSANTTLTGSGSTSAATIKGMSGGIVNLGMQPIILDYDGSDPALSISGGYLSLGRNAFTINSPSPLPVGVYTIVQDASGYPVIDGGSYPAAAGTAIGAGTTGSISVSGANVILTIAAGPAPVTALKFMPNLSHSGTSLAITATNTGAGTVYLLTSTNLTAPLNTWKPVWTNVAGGSGMLTANLSNVVNPALIQQFYILSTVIPPVSGGGPGPVSAVNSTIIPAIASLTANGSSTQAITLQSRDAKNNNETNGGATVVFSVSSGTGKISATTDNGDGTYSATLTAPASPGTGTVTAKLNGTAAGTASGANGSCAATYFSSKFGDPVTGLTPTLSSNFTTGFVAFTTVQTVASGLGPTFNSASCAACHAYPVTGGLGEVKITRYGLNTNGIFNALTNLGGTLLQGNTINISVTDAIPASANVVAQRQAISLLGAGLIEAIADSTIESNALIPNPDGIQGTVAMVHDSPTGQQRVGRFGWKAQHATILDFAADSANGEEGITSRIYPTGHYPQGSQTLYNEYNTVPDPNDVVNATGEADIDRDADYIRLLGPPPTLSLTTNAVAGQAVFHLISCDECHTPSLPTSPAYHPPSDLSLVSNVVITALSGKSANLYSDLLLHDMGTLNDGIAQGAATTNQMMTAPLWGLRMNFPYLHDGRATNVDEAIRDHDGDAAAAAARYINLSPTQQTNLLIFLNSL
jgi:autotransporter-associated beta strand protein